MSADCEDIMAREEPLPSDPESRLRRDSPLRPPEWRWKKAAILRAEGRSPDRLLDDEHIAAAVRYQAERSRCRSSSGLRALSRRHGALGDAYEISAEPDGGRKCELEARLLTGVGVDGTAQRMRLQPEVVTWYERLFFNVLDRLDDSSWMVHQVFGPKVYEGFSERDHDLIWKVFAYAGGAPMLDSLVGGGLVNPVRPDGPDQVRGFYANQTRAIVDRRSVLSALALRPTDASQRIKLLELQANLVEIEKKNGTGSSDDLVKQALGAALKSLPWRKGSPKTDGLEASESRAGDALRRAAGLEEPLKNMPKPEFPKKAPSRPLDEPAAGSDDGPQ
jgi:hypothetical protein